MLKFIHHILGLIKHWGGKLIHKILGFIKTCWPQVSKWMSAGLGLGAILHKIMSHLGLGS